MFKIEPIQDKAKQEELCKLFNIEYDIDLFGYYMYDLETQEPMGISQFEISGESGYIKDLAEYKDRNDYEAMFILGRQTMNFIDSCGAHIIYADDTSSDLRLLSAIGFKDRDEKGRLLVNTSGMFSGNCGNH